MNELPVRKANRLRYYDYSMNGVYFVTICTKNHDELFGYVLVGAIAPDRPSVANNQATVILTKLGECVDETIQVTNDGHDSDVRIDKYVIMPNHVHLIVIIRSEAGDRGRSPLQLVIRSIKSYVSKWAGGSVWQKSFYDHVIRDEDDYYRIAEYIENNPKRWAEDRYYKKKA